MPLYPILTLARSRACDNHFARRGSFNAFRLSTKNDAAARNVVKSIARPQGETLGITPVIFNTAASLLFVNTGYLAALFTISASLFQESISARFETRNSKRVRSELQNFLQLAMLLLYRISVPNTIALFNANLLLALSSSVMSMG